MTTPKPAVKLFGFQFSTARSVAEVTDEIMEAAMEKGVRQLITPNASTIVYFNERANTELKSFYKNARFILADGMPLVWLGRLKGLPLHRLTGSDLFPALWQRIKTQELNAVFVVANEGLARKLEAEHPSCRFVIPRMFQADDDRYITEVAAQVAAAVLEINAQFVFLGLNFPKQEKMGMRITSCLSGLADISVLISLLGASYEFYFSEKPRAPQWMQRNGLEWLHRFSKEPKRLWKRYTVDNIRFLILAIRELFFPLK